MERCLQDNLSLMGELEVTTVKVGTMDGTRGETDMAWQSTQSQVLCQLLCKLPRHLRSREAFAASFSQTRALRFKEALQRCQRLKVNLSDADISRQDKFNLKAASEGGSLQINIPTIP